MVEEKNVNKKGATRFVKTTIFDANILNEPSNKNIFKGSPSQIKQDNLAEKLKDYKIELLLNSGESDAYKEIYSDLADKIEYQYNKTEENSTRILGKIKAIESLITQENL